MLRRRERGRKEVKLVYGLNEQTSRHGDVSKSSIVRTHEFVGRKVSDTKPNTQEEPAEPDPWFAFEFLGALFGEPPARIAIRAPAPYRIRRPLSRYLALKSGGRRVDSVARAVPIETWAWPIFRSEATHWPQADTVFLDRLPAQLNIAIAEDEHDRPRDPIGNVRRRCWGCGRPISPAASLEVDR